MNNSIYKLSNDKHVDLGKIVSVGKVYKVCEPNVLLYVGFSVSMQLSNKDIELLWVNDTENKIDTINRVNEQHRLLIHAWKECNLKQQGFFKRLFS